MEVVSIPVIVAIVYAVVEVYKVIFKNNEKAKNIIPIVSGALGTILGVVFFYAVPTIVPADNALLSAFFGLCSGLTATGSNQIVKQLVKMYNDIKSNTQIGDGKDAEEKKDE